jgi:ATP-dependent helicase/nuclease subunit B
MTGSVFDGPAPRWFSIDAHRPFLADLAAVLFETLAADDPAGLSRAVVLVPTRRGARALAQAFVGAAGGRPVLLPQILALGDLEDGEPPFEPGDLALELPPAVSPMRRRFELARLILDHAGSHAEGFAPALGAQGALHLADALADVLDSAAIEEARLPDDPQGLLLGEFAEHWKVSGSALRVAAELWPARLATLGVMDVAARRTALLNALAERWRSAPPGRPLVAAGSTGSAPATARLLAVIASAPTGLVVLPGLDRDLADSAWAEVGDDHPQGALRRLLTEAGVQRSEVRPWPAWESAAEAAHGRARRRIVNEALRPAEATRDWRTQILALRAEAGASGADPIAAGLSGLTLLEARAEEDAASAIALLMREALETPGRTAALITPDQALARRVSARLARWRVEADTSAGRPLAEAPIGTLLGLAAEAVAQGFDPPTLLALLKHPLVDLANGKAAALRTLERRGLRGPRPRGWSGLRARLDGEQDRRPSEHRMSEHAPSERRSPYEGAIALADALEEALSPLAAVFDGGAAPPAGAAEDLVRTVEALSSSAWNGQTGEAASGLIAQLVEHAAVLPPIGASAFADLIRELLTGQMVRPGGALHPRLQILGAIEARLVRADLLIVAGLEEGVWPRLPAVDPFFSRSMRKNLGLPPPERRIGLAAHDFAQAASAPQVVLVACDRRGGQPAVRSRWLWRLQTLARGAGLELPRRPELLEWARLIDAPLAPVPADLKAAPRPAPKPPAEVRPDRMPVTRIETWVRDPYAVYAREILRLRPLDPPDAAMDARARGTAIHRAFQSFAEAHAPGTPSDPARLFEQLLVEALEGAGVSQSAMARERALARRLAAWAAEFEAGRRSGGRRFLIEREGRLAIAVQGRPFTVTAKADRIEIEGGLADVLDFKTGAAPTRKQIERGFAPQLTLTAAILMGGGFDGVAGVDPGDLIYVRVTGRRVPGEEQRPLPPGVSREEAGRALAGLAARVARFRDPGQPYRSWAAPQFIGDRGIGDYDHLARVFEWHVAGTGDEGGEA